MYFQDRVSGLLDAHLSAVSNRLNEVMKVLTVISTIFMPLTVLTGIYGMNVDLPQLPGGPRRSSGGSSASCSVSGTMLLVVPPERLDLGEPHPSSTASPRESDRRRRGRRAPGLGGQGAGRERARRRARRGSRSPIEFGGKKLIRVEDDGERDGAGRRRSWRSSATPPARFATPDDLGAIRTLGFRGEALPSIASVVAFRAAHARRAAPTAAPRSGSTAGRWRRSARSARRDGTSIEVARSVLQPAGPAQVPRSPTPPSRRRSRGS